MSRFKEREEREVRNRATDHLKKKEKRERRIYDHVKERKSGEKEEEK